MSASGIHLKIGDIKGESTDDKHKDEIDVDNWTWGARNPNLTTPGSGSGAGKVIFSDISFGHRIDKASPNLWKACATGEHIKDAVLTSAKQGGGPQDFLIIKMTDVLITSVSMSVAASNDAASMPTELFTMQFGKVDFEYKLQKPDGSADAGVHFIYDVKTGKVG